jgi:hypothetical protein
MDGVEAGPVGEPHPSVCVLMACSISSPRRVRAHRLGSPLECPSPVLMTRPRLSKRRRSDKRRLVSATGLPSGLIHVEIIFACDGLLFPTVFFGASQYAPRDEIDVFTVFARADQTLNGTVAEITRLPGVDVVLVQVPRDVDSPFNDFFGLGEEHLRTITGGGQERTPTTGRPIDLHRPFPFFPSFEIAFPHIQVVVAARILVSPKNPHPITGDGMIQIRRRQPVHCTAVFKAEGSVRLGRTARQDVHETKLASGPPIQVILGYPTVYRIRPRQASFASKKTRDRSPELGATIRDTGSVPFPVKYPNCKGVLSGGLAVITGLRAPVRSTT